MELIVREDFWQLFPSARIGILIAENIDNRRNGGTAAALLQQAVSETAAAFAAVEMAAHPAVAPWRSAYAAFGAKPSKYRSSIEALLRSAVSGRLGSINPLVDLYNSVSLRVRLPCGGEDLDRIVGGIELTRAVGGEDFRTIGAEASDPAVRGEVIYRDDLGAICRNWNWREADRTQLTADTGRAVLVFESVDPATRPQLMQGLAELSDLMTAQLGARTRQTVLTPETPATPLQL